MQKLRIIRPRPLNKMAVRSVSAQSNFFFSTLQIAPILATGGRQWRASVTHFATTGQIAMRRSRKSHCNQMTCMAPRKISNSFHFCTLLAFRSHADSARMSYWGRNIVYPTQVAIRGSADELTYVHSRDEVQSCSIDDRAPPRRYVVCRMTKMVQSCPEASPVKWHQAHTTWFFETFILRPFLADTGPSTKSFIASSTSYYISLGEEIPDKKLPRIILSTKTR